MYLDHTMMWLLRIKKFNKGAFRSFIRIQVHFFIVFFHVVNQFFFRGYSIKTTMNQYYYGKNSKNLICFSI
jgi:hypothetical protein